MSKEGKHHHIPKFYLKSWADPRDRCVCEFSKPYDRVKPKRVDPDGTGYVHGLNRIPGIPAHEADSLETRFFRTTDDLASQALAILLGDEPYQFSIGQRSAWARFLVSLVARHPESVARHMAAGAALLQESLPEIRAEYERARKPHDPPTYEEYAALHSPNPGGRAGALLLQSVIDSPLIGNHLIRMRWIVLRDELPLYPLLTSDRPIIMTNGLVRPEDQIILPISPIAIFVATNTIETENFIRRTRRRDIFRQVNERVARQSRKYVYGSNDSQLDFVSKRLGSAWTADPLENLSLELPSDKVA